MKVLKAIFNPILLIIIFLLLIFYFSFKNDFGKMSFKSSKNENISTSKIDSTSSLNILFVGDVMLDRYIREKINEADSVEDFVDNFLTNLSIENKKYDYVVANLEGPITENKSKTLNDDGTFAKDLIFTFPTSSPEILKLLNIKVVSLANNHTDNFYYAGFQSTIKFLEKSNINYFGNPYNSEKDGLSKVVCESSICMGYVAYNQFTGENNPEIVVDEIKKLKEEKKVDFIVVFAHWGVEYALKANSIQKNYAHEWVDAGADLIIGAHPHVIEESEIYNGKYIYYSLGNYIFDQWFDKNVSKGLQVNFLFKKGVDGNKNIELIKELNTNISRKGIKYIN